MSEREAWERHWSRPSGRSLFEKLSTLVRTQILSRAVRDYTDRFFPSHGTFLECGCGTGQSSIRILRSGRRLVAVDLSTAALRSVRRLSLYDGCLQADVRKLPITDDSVAGIWNLGVMEHFPPDEVDRVLEEFRRVLKPGHTVILFWPPALGSSRLALAPVERFLSWRRRRPFRFFPDEPSRLRSRKEAFDRLTATGFEPVAADFGPRDAFIHVVVVGRKPGA